MYFADQVTFEGQIAVFEYPPHHTDFLAAIEARYAQHRLRATGCAVNQGQRSSGGKYMPDSFTLEGQIATFAHSTAHTEFLRELAM